MADTSTTSKVFSQLVHAFVAAPGRQGTVVRTELMTAVVVVMSDAFDCSTEEVHPVMKQARQTRTTRPVGLHGIDLMGNTVCHLNCFTIDSHPESK